MEECSKIENSSSPIQQGDILIFPDNDDGSKYGIIVTGDCDIAQKKCRGVISYCNITTVKYFITHEFLKDNFIEKELKKLEENITKRTCKLLKAEMSSTFFYNIINLSTEKLHSLLNDDGDLLKKIDSYKEITEKKCFSFSDYRSLLRLNNCLNDAQLEEKVKKAKETLKSKLNNLPGDKFFITELPDQNDNYGYIVHLRIIDSIKQSDIEDKFNKSVYRIGHLTAPFLYRLTQQLGAVFSDIGLPSEYEKYRSNIADFLLEEMEK